jgi:hypothetical protein
MRRPNFKFAEMGIPPGSILQCTKNNEKIAVLLNNKVLFRGEEMSLSKANEIICNQSKANLDSFGIWTYKDRNFLDIYNETYSE